MNDGAQQSGVEASLDFDGGACNAHAQAGFCGGDRNGVQDVDDLPSAVDRVFGDRFGEASSPVIILMDRSSIKIAPLLDGHFRLSVVFKAFAPLLSQVYSVH